MGKINLTTAQIEERLNVIPDLEKIIKDGGITIVDSIDKLDPNAELGSLAIVVEPGSIKESSFRDLYQPDASILDQTTSTITQPELLSSVTSINFLTPTDYSGVETVIILVPRTLSQTDVRMIQLMVAYSDGMLVGVAAVYINQTTGEQAEFIVGQVVDGVYTIDDTVVVAINDILASDDWCYLGIEIMSGAPMTEEQFATLDKFARPVAGVPSTADIYVKGDKWAQLYKKDLENLVNSIDTLSNTKDNIIPIESAPYSGFLKPNTYYTDTSYSATTKTYILATPADTTRYNEYIIELKCTGALASVLFTDESGTDLTIKWSNGTAPTFENGNTYIISIVNGFGVFAQFANS